MNDNVVYFRSNKICGYITVYEVSYDNGEVKLSTSIGSLVNAELFNDDILNIFSTKISGENPDECEFKAVIKERKRKLKNIEINVEK